MVKILPICLILAITIIQGKTSRPLKEVSKSLDSPFSRADEAWNSITKTCEKFRSFSIQFEKVCEDLEVQSSSFKSLKTQVINSIKYYSELKDPPTKRFESYKDSKLVSLTNTKIASNTLVTERIPLHNHRFSSFYELTQLLIQRNFKIFVETGTIQSGPEWCVQDGCSTVILAKIAQIIGANLYSVDTNPAACIKSREVCEPFSDSVQVIEGNSISFLNTFNDGLIDLLYLDSLDFDENNPGYSQEHYKNEVIAAYDKLHRNSIVMIDDCKLKDGGKCKLVREFLLSKGWTLYFSSYQEIFIYRD